MKQLATDVINQAVTKAYDMVTYPLMVLGLCCLLAMVGRVGTGFGPVGDSNDD